MKYLRKYLSEIKNYELKKQAHNIIKKITIKSDYRRERALKFGVSVKLSEWNC